MSSMLWSKARSVRNWRSVAWPALQRLWLLPGGPVLCAAFREEALRPEAAPAVHLLIERPGLTTPEPWQEALWASLVRLATRSKRDVVISVVPIYAEFS
ncbi:unnamed protein product, partial [Polarella glacialis]